jgi:hypothetical protein
MEDGMETLDSDRARSGRRWIWILAGVVVLVAGAPILFLAFYGGVATVHQWAAPMITLPPLHGRVIDGATGNGISGARVMRGFFQEGAAKGFDGAAPEGIAGSLVESTTDSQGSFVLPGTGGIARHGIRGLTGMSWVVFRSGWMPAYGCYWEAPMRGGGCSGFGGMDFTDLWFRPKFDRHEDELDLEVRLLAPPATGAPPITFDTGGQITTTRRLFTSRRGRTMELDPRGEYFRRMNILVQHHYLEADVFVKEAVAYAEKGFPLSDGVASQFLQLVGAPILERPIPRDRDREVVRVRKAILDYCDQTPGSEFCRGSAVGVGYIRDFFQKETTRAR